jgi:hypothetical protein
MDTNIRTLPRGRFLKLEGVLPRAVAGDLGDGNLAVQGDTHERASKARRDGDRRRVVSAQPSDGSEDVIGEDRLPLAGEREEIKDTEFYGLDK